MSENIVNVMKVIRDVVHPHSESIKVVKKTLYVKVSLLAKIREATKNFNRNE